MSLVIVDCDPETDYGLIGQNPLILGTKNYAWEGECVSMLLLMGKSGQKSSLPIRGEGSFLNICLFRGPYLGGILMLS